MIPYPNGTALDTTWLNSPRSNTVGMVLTGPWEPFVPWTNLRDRDRFMLARVGRQIGARAPVSALGTREGLRMCVGTHACRPLRQPRQRGHLGWVRRGGSRPVPSRC